MKRWFLGAALALLAPLTLAAALDAKGVVYNDANGNGARDEGERGIASVLVSNGVDVVSTGKAGEYSIPVTDDTILFVIKPRGWTTPVGPGNDVPRFYYIHKPNGSPKMKYEGVAPTGSLPASVDFPLQKQREHNRFRVICMGDSQTRNLEEVQYLAHDILEEIKDSGTDAVFGITLGDNVYNDLTVFEPLVETMSSLDMPWRYVPGNHDHNHDAPTVEATDDTFERLFGPSYYAFNYGPVHFIVLNDIGHEAAKDSYRGGLGERQLTFIKNDLAHVSPKQLVVLMMHIPLMELQDAEALYALLKDFPCTFSLSAHTHRQFHVFLDRQAGWQRDEPHHHFNHGTSCGSWWGGSLDETGIPLAQMEDGGPNNYSLITFDGATYDIECRIPRRPAGYQMNIWLPEQIACADTATTAAIVNVFAGSSKSSVRMRVDSTGDWIPMQQYTDKDPYLRAATRRQDAFVAKMAELNGVKEIKQPFSNKVLAEYGTMSSSMSRASMTDHLWRANLPRCLAPGHHTLEVQTTDMFGRTYSGTRVFIVRK